MKYKKLEVRITEKEKEHLLIKAQKNGLSLSEYARIRLLEEDELAKHSLCNRNIATLTALSYYLIGKIAKRQLLEEDLLDASRRAELFLKENNLD